jgi:phage terminase large subunit
MEPLRIEIPEKLAFLFRPMRYKVLHGGRGSSKSWSIARALIARAYREPVRVMCAREIQKSIKQSVHKLLKDQIEALGLGSFFTVLETEIRGNNGSEFSFTGLQDHTVDSIKSFEGCDVCWIEEGQTISKRSMDILVPTIRKAGSEIWVSMNPDLDTDEMAQRFLSNTPDDCIACQVNYIDNPWFNDVLEKERIRCKEQSPDDYDNIWLGKFRPAAEGAIYYKEMESAREQGRICDVPYDPLLRVHVVCDIGWNDAMTFALVQRVASSVRIIDYLADSHKTLDYYSSVLKDKRLNWGKMWLPHDGYSGDVKTGKSCADILRKLGWDVPRREDIAEYGIEDGIRTARLTFPRVYFDRKRVAEPHEQAEIPLVECLKRYRRNINRQSGEATTPLHDKYSHGADVFRYLCVNVDLMKNEEDRRPSPVFNAYAYTPVLDPVAGY